MGMISTAAERKRARSRYIGMNPAVASGRAVAYDIKQSTGVLSDSDATRMAKRQSPGAFGIDPSTFPESAPDAEEVMRRNRRKFLSQQRRRSGRMSTILTGGDTSGMGLG